jgi:hypothetical protein
VPAPPSSSPALRLAAAVPGGVGAGLGLALLTGPGLPLDFGAGPACAALGLAAGLGIWRGRSLRSRVAAAGGWSAALAGPGAPGRWIVAGLLLLPGVIVAASVARAIAGLCVAFPPAIAGLGVLWLLAWVPARRRALGVVLGLVTVALALAAAIGAARLEGEWPGARGFAHGGPILGIHPFQTTAIVIDGYGPFDLPINDYVEPDGARGYGPEALAEALQRDLAAISELQYADGPARAYQAFAAARVEAVTLPAVQERLDRPPERGETEPAIVVWSGNYGAGSRVEFVCPGLRNDPRPREADPVMERMCPDKYSAEASAGLGLTGRWTGYSEGRGNAGLSLARALGWSRIDERTQRWEPRLWAWIALLLVGALAWRPRRLAGLARGAGALALVAVAVFMVMVVWTWPLVQVDWLTRAPAWGSPWSLTLWAPTLALVLALNLGGLFGAGGEGPRARGFGWWPGVVLGVTTGLTTWALAGDLAALGWADRSPTDGLEPLALGIGEALHRQVGIDLPVAEAIAATALLAGLLALLTATLGPLPRLCCGLLRPGRPEGIGRRIGPALVALVVVLAGLLVLSRMTVGGAALLGPALALALAAGTGLALLAGPADGGRGRWLRAVDHALMVGLVLWAASQAWAERGNPMMAATLVVGSAAALVSLVLLRRPTAVRSQHGGPQGPVAP